MCLKLAKLISTRDNLVGLMAFILLFSLVQILIFSNSGIVFSYYNNYRARSGIQFIRTRNLNLKNSYKSIVPLCEKLTCVCK